MSRYIDADRLIYSRVRIIHSDGTAGGWNAVVMSSVINNTPTADVTPVRHGHWIEDNKRQKSYKFICSECGGVAYSPQPNTKKPHTKACAYKYCPHCGAIMDGERKRNENT